MATKMNCTERLCATLLFFFSSGADAKEVVESGSKSVGIRMPTDEDLDEVLHRTPAVVWNGAMEVARSLVADIVENEPRDAIATIKDFVGTIRRGKEVLDKKVGPLRPLHELIDSPYVKKTGRGK